ncbi:membrane protein insertase YidC [Aquibaculum sediminis]|uniref:membrane protein insertase YidC n=1 Tax=Aquibaculum sediminis TaxID=3231907 RepID=UPI003452B4C4
MDQKNLLLAIVFSLAILLGFEFLVSGPQRERLAEEQRQQETAELSTAPTAGDAPIPGDAARPGASGPDTDAALQDAMDGRPSGMQTEAALSQSPRVEVETPTLTGSLSLVGGRVDDLVLKDYRETIDPDSPRIRLLHPAASAQPYFADFGWTARQEGVSLPQGDSEWRLVEGERLTPANPVVIEWDNGEGLTFRRTFEIDENYMFTVNQEVRNDSDSPLSMAPYGLISRSGTPDTLGFFILHEGLIGVFNDSLQQTSYSSIRDDGVESWTTTGGWLGITDKYWMAALAPDPTESVTARFLHSGGGGPKYQTDLVYGLRDIAPGESLSQTTHLFAGAKEVTLLDDYRDDLGISNFDLAVDFGWFYFLTKPIFYVLHWLAGIIGNFGVAILILTVMIKMVFFPLANKSYRSMAKLRKLQPEMMKLKERFGDDRQRMNQEMMALYRKEGANPVAGCLPIVIQIPVFFALYKVLFVTIEMRHTPFFGWIQDLSAPDPTSIFNLFGLLPYDVPNLGMLAILSIGVWPILMGISMYAQQLLNPQPPDPIQARIFLALPVVFTFVLGSFPAGLVIYWTWNNVLSVIQQYVIMRQAGVPIGRKAAATPATSGSGSDESGDSKGKEKAPADTSSGGKRKAKSKR